MDLYIEEMKKPGQASVISLSVVVPYLFIYLKKGVSVTVSGKSAWIQAFTVFERCLGQEKQAQL